MKKIFSLAICCLLATVALANDDKAPSTKAHENEVKNQKPEMLH